MLIPFSEVVKEFNLTPKGILHVGAWDGAEMEQYAAEGITNVVFIEAQQTIMPTLLGRIAPYPDARAFNYCVSDKVEDVNFMATSNGQSSSILELGEHAEIYPHIKSIGSFSVKALPLEEIFFIERLGQYDFVNMDIQGAELKAIKGMGSLIHNVKCFYLEVNKKKTYIDCALVDDVDSYLAGFGFTRVKTAAWVDDCWTDAVYLR